MTQSVLPSGKDTSKIPPADELRQPALATVNSHEIALPQITAKQAKLKIGSGDVIALTSTSTMYHQARQQALEEQGAPVAKNKQVKVYSCGKFAQPKNKETNHKQIRKMVFVGIVTRPMMNG